MQKSAVLILMLALVCAGCSREKDDWKTAQAADTTEAYQEFMRQHPDSELGVQAQARVKQLSEDRDWQQAAAADTRDAYEQFVAQHADSKWAQEARVRIENLNLGGPSQPAAAGTATDASGAPAAAGEVAAAGAAVGAAAVAAAGGAAPSAPAKSAPPAVVATPQPRVARPTAPAAVAKAPKPAKAARSATHTASKPAVAHASGNGKHYVQLGAFSSQERAEKLWKTLSGKQAAALGGVEPVYDVITTAGGRKLHRLRGVVASTARGSEVCAALTRSGQSCIVVKR